ncbi:MAG: glycosyltransferase family 4 protein [Planctomycetes bacterium]|nr:glycosyltransferase family 4 protein [Planctomycetota bacterium]
MRKLRVLQVLEATIGGTKKHVLQILSHLPRDRYVLSFVCSTLRDPVFQKDIEALRAAGVNVTVIQMPRSIRPLADLRALWNLLGHMRRCRYDIVHTHSSKAGILGRLAARLARVPVVIHTPHAFAFEMTTGRFTKTAYRLVEKTCAHFTDAVVAVSEHERRLAAGLGVLPPHRIFTIENVLDAEDLKRPRTRAKTRKELGLRSKQILVGAVGRLTRQKGLPVLLDAAAKLSREFPDMHFLIAGSGDEEYSLRRKLAQLGIADKVLMPGHREDTRDLYAAMDLFVLPSLWEGRPYALLEAMAAGKPVVASDVCGLDDVIEDGVNGMLVPPGDATSLAQAVSCLAQDATLRRRLGRAARSTVQIRYRIEDAVTKLDALYARFAAM